jgi:hypothetical protein
MIGLSVGHHMFFDTTNNNVVTPAVARSPGAKSSAIMRIPKRRVV